MKLAPELKVTEDILAEFEAISPKPEEVFFEDAYNSYMVNIDGFLVLSNYNKLWENYLKLKLQNLAYEKRIADALYIAGQAHIGYGMLLSQSCVISAILRAKAHLEDFSIVYDCKVTERLNNLTRRDYEHKQSN